MESSNNVQKYDWRVEIILSDISNTLARISLLIIELQLEMFIIIRAIQSLKCSQGAVRQLHYSFAFTKAVYPHVQRNDDLNQL